MTAVAVAVIGLGRIGAEHLRLALAHPDVHVDAVLEPDAARAQVVLADRSIAHYSDLVQLTEQANVDAAIVAAPTAAHCSIVEHLIEAGIAVLCEKPCGLTSEEVSRLAQRAEEIGTPVLVGYWRRHVPELAAVRRAIQDGDLGTVFAAVCWTWDEHPPPPAFRDPASSGGLLADVGVHDIDLLRWLTGQEVRRAVAYTSRLTSAPPVAGDPECASLMLELEGGLTALVTLGRRRPDGELERIDLLGSARVIELPYVTQRTGASVIADAMSRQLDDLVSVARGGTAAASPGAREAEAVLRVVESLGRSEGRASDA